MAGEGSDRCGEIQAQTEIRTIILFSPGFLWRYFWGLTHDCFHSSPSFPLYLQLQTYIHNLTQIILAGSCRHTQFMIIWKSADKCLWYTVKWLGYSNIMSNMGSKINVVNKTSSIFTLFWFRNELCKVPCQTSTEKNDKISLLKGNMLYLFLVPLSKQGRGLLSPD